MTAKKDGENVYFYFVRILSDQTLVLTYCDTYDDRADMTSIKTTGAASKRSMFDLSDDGGSDSDADDALLLAAEAAERDQPVDDRLQSRPLVTEDTSQKENPKMTSDQAARAEKNRLKVRLCV